jgi:hypothetical protein
MQPVIYDPCNQSDTRECQPCAQDNIELCANPLSVIYNPPTYILAYFGTTQKFKLGQKVETKLWSRYGEDYTTTHVPGFDAQGGAVQVVNPVYP